MALTETPTPERVNFLRFLWREKEVWGKPLRSVLAEAFATKKDLIRQLEETKGRIKDLEHQQSALESRIRHYTDKKDEKFILKHWQKLLYLYQKYHPRIFESIVVSCFDFYILECKWGINDGKCAVRLSDLLEKWSNGCTYEEMPVVKVVKRVSPYRKNVTELIVYITPDGALRTTTCYDGTQKYIDFLRYWPECPAWSERSVSDFKFNSHSKITK